MSCSRCASWCGGRERERADRERERIAPLHVLLGMLAWRQRDNQCVLIEMDSRDNQHFAMAGIDRPLVRLPVAPPKTKLETKVA